MKLPLLLLMFLVLPVAGFSLGYSSGSSQGRVRTDRVLATGQELLASLEQSTASLTRCNDALEVTLKLVGQKATP